MKIKKILIAQPEQSGNNTQFVRLSEKYGIQLDFKPFFKNVPLTLNTFRAQKINIPDFTAIVFSSKGAIDAFFKLCKELRYKVPDDLKYFCISDAVAYYLQKHVVFRKRKIFFGVGTINSVIKLCKGERHRKEKFLVTYTGHINKDWNALFSEAKLNFSNAIVSAFENCNLDEVKISDYQIIALYSAHDVRSLLINFPSYKQRDTLCIIFGQGTAAEMDKAGLNYIMAGPATEFPSLTSAIETCITDPNKMISIASNKKTKPAKSREKTSQKKSKRKTATSKEKAPVEKKQAVQGVVKKTVTKKTTAKTSVKTQKVKSTKQKVTPDASNKRATKANSKKVSSSKNAVTKSVKKQEQKTPKKRGTSTSAPTKKVVKTREPKALKKRAVKKQGDKKGTKTR